MNDLIDRDIEKIILGKLYDLFFEKIKDIKTIPLSYLDFSRFILNTEKILKNLSSNFDRLDFFKVFNCLEKEGLLQKTQENFDYRQNISLTLKGFIRYEQKYKENSKNLQELLYKILKRIAEEEREDRDLSTLKIPIVHFFDTLNLKDNLENRNTIICLINELSKNAYFFRKDSPYVYSNFYGVVDSFYFNKKDFLVLDDKGRKLISLKTFNKFNINEELVLEEYNQLQLIIHIGIWKDACIKIGSILEYLITKWLEFKNIQNLMKFNSIKTVTLDRSNFVDKIHHYINKIGKLYNYEIGNEISWRITDIIRDYRNDIHLQKYEKRLQTTGPLNEESFNLLFPAFEKIISYFSN